MQSAAASEVTVVVAARGSIGRPVADALASAGFTVAASCATFEEALAAVKRWRPRVCILDRELTGGGLAGVAALAVPGRHPKVIVLADAASPAEVRAARLAGATVCLTASIEPDRLAAAVAAAAAKQP
jgi:DNA-binding NarL/FixJ family response regulator